MTADPAAMAAGLASNIQTISNLTVYQFVADKPEPPCVVLKPLTPWVPESMARGIFTYRFTALVLVTDVTDSAAWQQIYAYTKSSGTSSVFAAIETDKTLGGAASNATVEEISQLGEVSWNDLRYLGAELTIKVLATG